MLAMTGAASLVVIWFTFLVVALVGVAAAIVWAVRSGQFTNQDRARYLPLQSGIPKSHAGASNGEKTDVPT
jgi:hypothetical protein